MSERIGLGVRRYRDGKLSSVIARGQGVTTKFYNIRQVANNIIGMECFSDTTDKKIYQKHQKKVDELLQSK